MRKSPARPQETPGRIASVAHTHIHALLGIFHSGLMAAVIDCANSLLGEPNA
jgi:hypothetical protein